MKRPNHLGDRVRLLEPAFPWTGRNPIPAGSTGRVTCVSGTRREFTISLDWDDPHRFRNVYLSDATNAEIVEES